MLKIAGIVQARMGSTRLPGKVLTNICGKPVLKHIVDRVSLSKINQLIIATTNELIDDEIEIYCNNSGINFFRGDSENVLNRFYDCTIKYPCDIIVRITADDPFKDPVIIDKAIDLLINGKYDYVSNTIIPTYPEGLDIEVFTFKALAKTFNEAFLPSQKEHVTPYIWNNPELFRIHNFSNSIDYSNLRWTLDTKDDLKFVKEIYRRLYRNEQMFYMNDILDIIKKEPFLAEINSKHKRNAGYLKSLENEKNI
ncbi:MAG: glycosyltransferase family protein [Leadbetterella sp.]|nr:glycosyltransferase family protein [Leadbetterella sp.]